MIRALWLAIALLPASLLAQVEARLWAETPADKQWARLHVAVDNRSTTSLSGLKAAYDLIIPFGKIPILEAWDLGGVKVRLEKRSDQDWRLWLENGQALAAGTTWNQGRGVFVGVRLSDWSQWNPQSAPSFDGNTGAWKLNSKISVWDASGRLIWGTGGPAIPAAYSSFVVAPSQGGACNVNGTTVVKRGETLRLFCTADQGYELSNWTLDGVVRSPTTPLEVVADGFDHRLEVVFKARQRFTVLVDKEGQGSCIPEGSSPVYKGDAFTATCSPADGWLLSTIQINGTNQEKNPVATISSVSGDSRIHAVFSPVPPPAQLSVLAQKGLPIDPKWSKVQIRVINTGNSAVEAGYQTIYVFRVPENTTPELSAWDLPSATAKLEPLASGYWRVRITSSTSLLPGQEAGAGRGFFFGLRIGSDFNWDVTGDVAMPQGTGWTSSSYIPVYSVDGKLLFGVEPVLNPARAQPTGISALYFDEGASANILRPRILIRNEGDRALSDFTFYYYFQTESGKPPVVDAYYPLDRRPSLEALGGGRYRLRFDYTGVTLAPRTDLPNAAGNVSGIHYADWSAWDRTNDCSHSHSGVQFLQNSRIPVYDRSGRLLWGEEGACSQGGGTTPSSEIAAPFIVLHPRDTSVANGARARFEVRAVGDGNLRYQWRHNGLDIPGANQAIFDIDRSFTEMNGDEYSCVVENLGGRAVSHRGRLTVRSTPIPPEILIQPEDDTVSLGGEAAFTVVATGADDLSYQWYRGSKLLPGATSSRYVIRGISARDSLEPVWVRVRSSNGKFIDSRRARVVIVPEKPSSLVLSLSGEFQDPATQTPPDTTVDLIARLFTLPEGGVLLWSEEHLDVPIRSGHWNLEVGRGKEGKRLSELATAHSALYLEIGLAGSISVLFSPRIPLTAVPYAHSAGARVLIGQGNPVQTALVGTLYLNQSDRRMWRRETTGWRRLDP